MHREMQEGDRRDDALELLLDHAWISSQRHL